MQKFSPPLILFLKTLYSILILIILPLISYSLDPNKKVTQYIYKTFQIEDGIPQNSIQCIIQSKNGYIWLATQEGVVRYDGLNFRVYNKYNVPQIKHNSIKCLLEDRKNQLWIGTEGGGLTVYKDEKFSEILLKNEVNVKFIKTIFEDKDGVLWFGTNGSGIIKYENQKFSYYNFNDGLTNTIVTSISQGSDGTLFFGTDGGGVNQYKNERFSKITIEGDPNFERIRVLLVDTKGILWIGTEGAGLIKYNNEQITIYKNNSGLNYDKIGLIYEDKQGILWLGTDNNGIYRFNGTNFDHITTKEGLSYNKVVSVCEDIENSLWIGTMGGGLNKIKDGKFSNLSIIDGLSYNHILAIFEDHEKAMWIGTDGKGVNKFKEGKVTCYTMKDGLSSNIITSLYEDNDYAMWIGTDGGGVNKLSHGKITQYTTKKGISHDRIRSIYKDSENAIWIATNGGGITKIKDDKFTYLNTKNGLSNDMVVQLYEDNEQSMWIGTYGGGLIRFRNNKFSYYNFNNGLSNDVVLSLYKDSENILWIGTFGGGLNWIKGDKINYCTSTDGLFDDTILAILEDNESNLWLSCNKGIFKVSKNTIIEYSEKKIKKLSCTNYGISDGMATQECNGGFSPAGWMSIDEGKGFVKNYSGQIGKVTSLYFPTINGLTYVNPDKIISNNVKPPVIIEQIRVNDIVLEYDNEKTDSLGYYIFDNSRCNFNFRYTACSFVYVRGVKFLCKLEGFDKKWHETKYDRRSMMYTNLQPGRYSFIVQACNNDGLWNEEGARFNFVIEPSFDQTIYFYLSIISGIILIGYIIYRLRVKQLKKRERLLEHKVKERTKDLLQAKEDAEAATKSKSAFLANMSHEIRTPLNAIVGLSYLASNTELNQKQQDYLTKIQTSANSLLGLINDILDFSKVEAGRLEIETTEFNLDEVLTTVARVVSNKAEEKKIEIYFLVHSKIPDVLIGDPYRLGQILINLINNAIKFTEKGEILIEAEITEHIKDSVLISFSVKDTGIGMTPEQLKKLFIPFVQADDSMTRKYGGTGLGLAITKTLVELLGGEIKATSKYQKGSTFIFTIRCNLKSNYKIKNRILPKEINGLHVLVADDSLTSQLVLKKMLQNMSCIVTCVSNGMDALKEVIIQSKKYDLIILDWKMPEIDGIETAYRIKSYNEVNESPKIILITAFGRDEIVDKAKRIGVDELIIKPVTEAILYKTVLNIFNDSEKIKDNSIKEDSVSNYNNVFNGAKILLVEDNLINQQVAKEIFEGFGLLVDISDNGKKAIEKIISTKEHFEAIIMDIQMPFMDGYQTTQYIRDKLGMKDIPIIALTAHAMQSEVHKCFEVGMNDHISKPIDPKKTITTLLKWIKPNIEIDELDVETQDLYVDKAEVFQKEFTELDIKSAFERLLGNQELYIFLLQSFVEKYSDVFNVLNNLLSEKDINNLQSTLHSLKGTAGNLSATRLFPLVKDIELMVKGKNLDIQDKLNELDEIIKNLCSEINTYTNKHQIVKENISTEKNELTTDMENIKSLITELDLFLKNNNLNARNKFKNLKEILLNTEEKDLLEEMETNLKKLDFKSARVILKILSEHLKIN